MRPLAYFVNALVRDAEGTLWVGARSKKEEPAALFGEEPSDLSKNEAPTGPVMALRSTGKEVWIGTDGRGVFRVAKEKTQRVTFDGTAGGLRSDHVYAIFADREGVIWFGTDRGVCRYDPHAPRSRIDQRYQREQFCSQLFSNQRGQTPGGNKPRTVCLRRADKAIWNPLPNSAATSFTQSRKTNRADCWSLRPVVFMLRQR